MSTQEYVNPTTGGPALPTMSCEMHRLMPGRRSAPVRRVGSAVVVVYAGAGTSVINGQRFEWSTGDMFVIPSWAAVDHQASEPTDLFVITDRPILEAFGLYREATLDSEQEVRRTPGGRARRRGRTPCPSVDEHRDLPDLLQPGPVGAVQAELLEADGPEELVADPGRG
jgi:hypothetical protein